MSDPTREQTVKKNIDDVVAKHGADAWLWIIAQCVQDISITLAKLLDK